MSATPPAKQGTATIPKPGAPQTAPPVNMAERNRNLLLLCLTALSVTFAGCAEDEAGEADAEADAFDAGPDMGPAPGGGPGAGYGAPTEVDDPASSPGGGST